MRVTGLMASLGLPPATRVRQVRPAEWPAEPPTIFNIEIEQCVGCRGRLKVLVSIEDPEVIARILAYRRERGQEDAPVASLGPRAPPPGMSEMLF
jgi:hypothetical protein